MAFNILHISDIHFQRDMPDGVIRRESIIDRIRETSLIADCIIISGDLFHQGVLSSKAASEFIEYLKRLKNAVQIPGTGGPIVLAVPGNHDLDRFAREEKGESYNDFVNRCKLVNKAGEEALRGNSYELGDGAEKEILYKHSFQAFRRFSQKIGSKTFSDSNTEAALTSDKYEVQYYQMPLEIGSDSQAMVRFVLLNTALFAGQSLDYQGFKKEIDLLESQKQAAINAGNAVKAAELNLQIEKQREKYEKYGCLVVDEVNVQGKGRLGLSWDGARKLIYDRPDTNVACTIFVGHHGYEYLSDQTKQSIGHAVTHGGRKEGVYLCGHAHQARYCKHEISTNKSIHQAQSGVISGNEDGFAEYGFNYITIDANGDGTKITVNAHFLCRNHAQEHQWNRELLFSVIHSSISQVQERNSNVKTEKIKEDVDPNTTGYDQKSGEDSKRPNENGPVEPGPSEEKFVGVTDDQKRRATKRSKGLLGSW